MYHQILQNQKEKKCVGSVRRILNFTILGLIWMTMWLTVLSRVQKGKAWGEREVGAGDVHSKGIGSLAAPRITASWNNTAVKEIYIINYKPKVINVHILMLGFSMVEFKIAIRPRLSPSPHLPSPPLPISPSPTPPQVPENSARNMFQTRLYFKYNQSSSARQLPLKITPLKFPLKQT